MRLIKILLGQLKYTYHRNPFVLEVWPLQSFQNMNLHTAGWLEPMYLSTLAVLT